MTNLMTASHQWATRPADERFINLHELGAKVGYQRSQSSAKVVPSRGIRAIPDGPKGLKVLGPQGNMVEITNYAFGQVANLAGAPAGYLRKLPSPVVADCINFGLHVERDISDVGLLLTKMEDNGPQIRAATGPNYGRIWNSDIVDSLIDMVGDGVTGDFRVPGEFGVKVPVTRENTTLYASDRDMFVFLADEEHRVEMDDRRDGKKGSLARGFFLWNSEVGDKTMGAAFFLFDYACKNRIVWGAREFTEMRLRHTVSAPSKWLANIQPVLQQYAAASAAPVEQAIKAAQAKRVDDDLAAFLKGRFGLSGSTTKQVIEAHEREEGRPIVSMWDVTTGITAYAKTLDFQDERVAMERIGGKVLDLVAN